MNQSTPSLKSSSVQEYQTFELLIGPKLAPGRYPVTIIDSPAGEGRALCRLNPQEPPWQELLSYVESGFLDAQILKTIGSTLFEGLFVGQIEHIFRESQGLVSGKGEFLRIRLRIEPPELAALPWEFLYDKQKDNFFSVSPDTALTRYIPMNERTHSVTVEPPLRVLVVISLPFDWPPLKVEKEKKTIQEALKEPIRQGKVELKILKKATVAHIAEAMRRFSPHVFHYVGHATFSEGQGKIVLENHNKYAHLVDEEVFRMLFSTSTQLAILNACQTGKISSSELLTGLAPNLLRSELSAVVAMQYPMPDRAALIFTREFYRTLALGYPLETAITEARKGIFVELGAHRREWGNPVLFLRAKDGQVFQIKQPEPKSVTTPDIPPPPEPQRPPESEGFVGREREFAYFAEKLETEGVAMISGMPGVGKTALAAELARGRGVEQSTQTFWHSIHASESVEVIIWKMAAFLAWHGQADLWQMMNGRLQIGGQLPPATTLLDYLFQIMREPRNGKPGEVGALQTFLLCFDDFHHLDDDPLLEPLKERLREAVRASDISLIITSRRTPDVLRRAKREPLMGLSAEDTHTLLSQRGIALPDELVKQLHTVTEGNAEFLTLTIASLKRARQPAHLIEHLVETEDIERYLLEEVDKGLTDEERDLKSSVAVLLGYPGTQDAIEEVYHRGRVRRILLELTGRYLLTVGEGEWGREYGQHAILRAYFYDLLTRRERGAMHRRAANYYEHEEPDMMRAISEISKVAQKERNRPF